MLALMNTKGPGNCAGGNSANELTRASWDELVIAMGKRLQAGYIDGAIPYLRQQEPELWTQLEALDLEESLDALLKYESLFFEGLRRYLSYLESQRQAA